MPQGLVLEASFAPRSLREGYLVFVKQFEDTFSIMSSSSILKNMAAEESTSNFQVINEEFKIWKKNCPFLYDVVVTHALEWPSLTCEWLPEPMVDEENHRVVHNLVLGTHCGEGAQNALLLANVTLPLASAGWDDVKVDANSKI